MDMHLVNKFACCNLSFVSSKVHVFGTFLDSRDKVKSLKETLNNCKNLLQCKRDDLRKHWIESMELNDVLFLLDKMYCMTSLFCNVMFNTNIIFECLHNPPSLVFEKLIHTMNLI